MLTCECFLLNGPFPRYPYHSGACHVAIHHRRGRYQPYIPSAFLCLTNQRFISITFDWHHPILGCGVWAGWGMPGCRSGDCPGHYFQCCRSAAIAMGRAPLTVFKHLQRARLQTQGCGVSGWSGPTRSGEVSHQPTGPGAGLLVKLQDAHPVNTMICMDFHGFPWIWPDFETWFGLILDKVWLGFPM